jgi:multiple sugar transport system ATP-binding protein
MSRIEFSRISKSFGKVRAINDLSLVVEEKEFLTVLGPSGCGKTTTLRCLAGLEMPDSGEITIGGKPVFSASSGIDVAPRDRRVGLVFQNYALYPHMTVARNVSFGLRNQRVPRAEIADRVAEVLDMVGLTGLEDRLPRELSGGQQQRVAVARMVVSRPRIFLFDEPLSNLDVKLRVTLRTELRRLHARLGVTSIYVTHDQQEAMSLSDRIVVMNKGGIEQIGAPREIYNTPATLFVAQFTGNPRTNLVEGSMRRVGGETSVMPRLNSRVLVPLEGTPEVEHGHDVVVNVRPEDVILDLYPGPQDLHFSVYACLDSGAESLVYLRSADNEQVVLRARSAEHQGLEIGRDVGVRFRRGNLYDADTQLLLDSFGYAQLPQRHADAARLTG